MTLDRAGRLLRRRWPLAGICLVLSLLAAVALTTPRPLYWTQTDVLFVGPGSTGAGAVDLSTREGLVGFVAMVERELNGGPVVRLSSPSATLYGAGVRSGHSVVLPDLGTQWESSFSRPVLSVEVVDATPERVVQVRATLLRRIEATVQRLQADLGIRPADFITVEPVTAEPAVLDVGTTRGGRLRALVVLTGLGAVATLALVGAVDRRDERRRRAEAAVASG